MDLAPGHRRGPAHHRLPPAGDGADRGQHGRRMAGVGRAGRPDRTGADPRLRGAGRGRRQGGRPLRAGRGRPALVRRGRAKQCRRSRRREAGRGTRLGTGDGVNRGGVAGTGVMTRLIDLSVASRSPPSEATPVVIELLDHRTGATVLGLGPDDFPGGMAISNETVTLTTHTGTHMDAPLHYGPISGASMWVPVCVV